ncbi:MAG: M20 family metallo-hydrolase [Microbacterium sp.]|uniref:M20 family metallo-hydrolase n=1 Tax=Microbacterium sp. TaxID=51671 RepID=UPI0039E45D46
MTAELRSPQADRLREDWEALARIRDDGLAGWTRQTFSEPERDSREWVAGLMRRAGLATRVDPIGNVIGELAGTDPNAAAIVIGSHTDTVAGGGRFDGVIGVLGAIEVVRLLAESGIRLRHPLRVVDYYNEEPNRFGLSCIGSRALAGNLRPEHLSLVDDEGVTLADALVADGRAPDRVRECAWAPREVAASLELHIEQGPVLESEGASLGVVTAIAGIARLRARFSGRRDHAGTMPMDRRHDASCSAAGAVLAIERIAAAGAGAVGTVGEIRLTPEATNVVTADALVTAEFRSSDPRWFAQARAALDDAVAEESARRGVAGAVDWLPPEPPTAMDTAVSAVLADGIGLLGHEARRLYSGAGHDAVQLARLAPAGMIFTPSQDGRSHAPEEWTDLADVALGVHALGQGVVLLDERSDR